MEDQTPEQIAQRLEEEAEARLKAMRATGTPVTVESFNAWVQRFEARARTPNDATFTSPFTTRACFIRARAVNGCFKSRRLVNEKKTKQKTKQKETKETAPRLSFS